MPEIQNATLATVMWALAAVSGVITVWLWWSRRSRRNDGVQSGPGVHIGGNAVPLGGSVVSIGQLGGQTGMTMSDGYATIPYYRLCELEAAERDLTTIKQAAQAPAPGTGDEADRAAEGLRKVIARLLETGPDEPLMAELPPSRKSTFWFCGRSPRQGHAPDCPWEEMLALAEHEGADAP